MRKKSNKQKVMISKVDDITTEQKILSYYNYVEGVQRTAKYNKLVSKGEALAREKGFDGLDRIFVEALSCNFAGINPIVIWYLYHSDFDTEFYDVTFEDLVKSRAEAKLKGCYNALPFPSSKELRSTLSLLPNLGEEIKTHFIRRHLACSISKEQLGLLDNPPSVQCMVAITRGLANVELSQAFQYYCGLITKPGIGRSNKAKQIVPLAARRLKTEEEFTDVGEYEVNFLQERIEDLEMQLRGLDCYE